VSAVSRRHLAALWLASFALYFSFFLLLPSLPLFVRSLGASDRAIGVIMGGFAVTSMLLRPWTGWAADRWGRRPFMLAGAAVFALAPLGYASSVGVLALVAVRLFHGAGMALYPTAASALVADAAPPARRGEFLGLFGAAGSIGMALGPIIGVALAARFGFAGLFATAGSVAVISMLLVLAMREARRPAVHVPFMPLHAARLEVNPGIFFLVYAASLTLTRGPAGRLSDRFGRRPVAAVGLVLAAVALGVLANGESASGLALSGAIYGLAGGIAQPALTAWCVDLAAPSDRGRAMGTFFTALELGIAIGAMSSGIAVAQWGFVVTFLASGGIALAGAGLALVLDPPRAVSAA
jgi:MFS family permease